MAVQLCSFASLVPSLMHSAGAERAQSLASFPRQNFFLFLTDVAADPMIRQDLFVSISGMIGAGKTTLATSLAKELDVPVYYERESVPPLSVPLSSASLAQVWSTMST